MARIALVSALIHATCYNQAGDEFKFIYIYKIFTREPATHTTSNMQVVTLHIRLRDKRLLDQMRPVPLPKVNNGNLVCI